MFIHSKLFKMKNLFFSLTLMMSTTVFGADPSLVTFNGTYNAARQKAVLEKKVLVLQFTAKWCQPCKYMEKEVFSNLSVQKLIQQKIVLLKLNIDDPRNEELKKEHKVTVLPTLIMMRASGKILARAEQSFNPESFIAWAEENINPNTVSKVDPTPSMDPNDSADPAGINASDDLDDFKELEEDDMIATSTGNSSLDRDIQASPKVVKDLNTYGLQTGVFSSKDNAELFGMKLLEQHQLDVRIAEETRKEKKLYKVIAGTFESLQEALLYRDYLQSKRITSVIVDQHLNLIK